MRRLVLIALLLVTPTTFAAAVPAMILPGADAYVAEAHTPVGLDAVRAAARAAWRAGDAPSAAAIAREFLRDVPPVSRPTRDSVLLQSAHFGAADATAHGALPSDPETIDGLVELGWFLQRGGDHRAAVDLLEAVLSRCPDQAEAHLLVSESRHALGHHDDAVRHALRYLALATPVPQS